MRAKCSGAKRGMPENSRSPLARRACRRCAACRGPSRRSRRPATLPRPPMRSRARNCCGDASRIGLPVRTCVTCMPGLEPARADAHERDAVAMLRVHVRLDLEHEAGELPDRRDRRARWSTRAASAAAPARGTRAGTARRRSSSARCRRTPATASPASTRFVAERMPRLVEQRDVVHEPLVRLGAEQVARSLGSSSDATCTVGARRAVVLAALEAGGSACAADRTRRRTRRPSGSAR